MAEPNGIKIPAWGVGIFVMALTSIISVAVSWGAMSAKIKDYSAVSDMTKKHDALIPVIQQDVREIKTDIREILRAVKQ